MSHVYMRGQGTLQSVGSMVNEPDNQHTVAVMQRMDKGGVKLDS